MTVQAQEPGSCIRDVNKVNRKEYGIEDKISHRILSVVEQPVCAGGSGDENKFMFLTSTLTKISRPFFVI